MIKDSPRSLYYSGTSGLLLSVRNKLFYPEAFKDKSRLCFYESMMNSIEVNSSFYKVPMPGTVAKWKDEVPDSFRFTFKLSKEVTHNKSLAFDPDLDDPKKQELKETDAINQEMSELRSSEVKASEPKGVAAWSN